MALGNIKICCEFTDLSAQWIDEICLFSVMTVYNTYLLLAEFSVRTVNYGPSFFPSIYGLSVKHAGHKSMEKHEDP